MFYEVSIHLGNPQWVVIISPHRLTFKFIGQFMLLILLEKNILDISQNFRFDGRLFRELIEFTSYLPRNPKINGNKVGALLWFGDNDIFAGRKLPTREWK